jgi:hypothetical protein
MFRCHCFQGRHAHDPAELADLPKGKEFALDDAEAIAFGKFLCRMTRMTRMTRTAIAAGCSWT